MEGLVPKFLIEQNVSYYTIPAAMLMGLTPRVATLGWYGRFFHAQYPRGLPDDIQLLPGNAVSPRVRARLLRADAAMQNAVENLPLFAAAVVAANASHGLSAAELNACCFGYLGLRALYMAFYVFWQDSPAFPALTRTFIWAMGVAVEMYLFVLAARQAPLVVVEGARTWRIWRSRARDSL
ncbi:uncharacterized protein PG986_003910 [Apiospora aurea]|uniref:MAPEG family protein n=1 Tax=Apiospora aurea TaxID=335848 RepID=A0ABR1QL28_9PEZI